MGRRPGDELDVVRAAGYSLRADGIRDDAAVSADIAADHDSAQRCCAPMTVFGIGISYGIATLLVMFSGMPIAFALGAFAVVFMAIDRPSASLDNVMQNGYEEMCSITLAS